jgi:hypothetical protein
VVAARGWGLKVQTNLSKCIPAGSTAALPCGGCRRPRIAAAAFALAALTVGFLRANTIQPILSSRTGPAGSLYTYTYDIELTPNNSLQNTSASPSGFPSSVTILDFGVVSGTPALSFGSGLFGADATAASDWNVSTNLTGASPLPNTGTPLGPGSLTLFGSQAFSNVSGSDSPTLSNITLEYTGAGLAASSTQQSLIQLQIVSNLVPGSSSPLSLSLDGVPSTGTQVPDSFALTTSNITTTFIPEPASVSLLGIAGGALLLRRKRSRIRHAE